ncbi:MAG: NADH-quinone oxidoreductase subunit J [Syntrophorhabdales bacterium]|jgi:NADH-quinone oxidoreductase subunit J
MSTAFYIAGAVAIISTLLAITRINAVHALLYLLVSLLSVALIFLFLGAPFVAAFEVIIYGGAIMVLFAFVIMMLGLGHKAMAQERGWLTLPVWLGPALLTAVLIIELFYVVYSGPFPMIRVVPTTPQEVAARLFGPYLLGVELVSVVLLLGLVGAFHLAYQLGKKERERKRGAHQ